MKPTGANLTIYPFSEEKETMKSTSDNLRDQLKALPLGELLNLTPSPKAGQGFYNCPACGSGTHAHGTGALHYEPGKGWHCFACGKDGMGLLMNEWGTDYKGTLAKLKELGYISLEERLDLQPKAPTGAAATSQPTDYKEQIWEWAGELQRNQEALDYLKARGIKATYPLGYDHKARRIIIPLNDELTAYTARAIDKDTEPRYKAQGAAVWNHHRALKEEGEYLFIVEGAMDGLVMLQAGQPTLSLLGADNWDKVNARGVSKRIILCLDNDSKGQEAQRQLAQKLQAAGVEVVRAQLPKEYKDPGEYAAADYEAFKAWAEKESKRESIQSTAALLPNYLQQREAYINAATLETPWDELNALLFGGLRPWLYCLGAMSSMGKTTWALQLADFVAQQGKHALYVSLEQSAFELLSKSLARQSWQGAGYTNKTKKAWTNTQIMLGRKVEALTQDLTTIMDEYHKAVRDRMRILEGNSATTLESIAQAARRYKAKDQLDFLVIDYLQILKTGASYGTDKEKVDNLMGDIKRLSTELNIPILVLSSFGRASYNQRATMESFKESGGIEYGADCLLALQPKGQGFYTDKQKSQAKADNADYFREVARGVEVEIIKARLAKRGTAYLSYYTPYDCYGAFNQEAMDELNREDKLGGFRS